jgi:hypothetical protein
MIHIRSIIIAYLTAIEWEFEKSKAGNVEPVIFRICLGTMRSSNV